MYLYLNLFAGNVQSLLHRVQQPEPEPEVRQSEVIRTSSLAQNTDHLPGLVVSPASPSETPLKEYAFEAVVVSSPALKQGIKMIRRFCSLQDQV